MSSASFRKNRFFPAIRQEEGSKSTRAALGDLGASAVFSGFSGLVSIGFLTPHASFGYAVEFPSHCSTRRVC